MENTKFYVIIDHEDIREYNTEAEAFKAYVEIKRHPNMNRVREIIEMKNSPNRNEGKGICVSRHLGYEWRFDNATGWTKKTGYTMW